MFSSSILRHALLALSLTAAAVRAQPSLVYSDKAEAIFKDGVSLYSATMYRDAIADFDRIIREFPASQRVTGAYVMKGKALYLVQEYLETAKTLRDFLSRYPASSYVPDAALTLGLVYQRVGRYNEALDEYMTALRALPNQPSQRLFHEITDALDTVLQAHGTVESLQRLLGEINSADGRAFFWMRIARKCIASGDVTLAMTALDTLTTRYAGSADPKQIAELRGTVNRQSTIKLGALMPLMNNSEPSAIKEIGVEVYDGVEYAFEQYAKDPSARIKVTLETRDTEREARLAAQEAQELSADSGVIGIIGPVFSMNAIPAATVANAQRVPIVTPTANANGIAAVGPYVFQANPDYETRGAAMAQYAVTVRGYKTIAVLAPSDTYGRFLAEGFLKEAARLGAKVLATEWYQHGASDLKAQLGNIRRAAMAVGATPLITFAGRMDPPAVMKLVEAGVPRKRIDSLMSRGGIMKAIDLLGPDAQAKIDTFGIAVTYDQSEVDSLQYPVESVQCFYAPISSAEEIGVVSSQIVYFNFHTQLLGSGEWNTIGELSANARYCRGVLFDADSYTDTSKGMYSAFLNGYDSRFKKHPSKNALYGYDTATLMLDLIKNGAATRDALTRALSGLRDYQGVHTRIGFSSRRVNSWLTILQFDGDRISNVGEVHVEE